MTGPHVLVEPDPPVPADDVTAVCEAIAAGHEVMIFSDNVSLEHEVALKRAAAERGLLVMGPDCGTARRARRARGAHDVGIR